MPGPLPGFWCWVTFSPYSSQNQEGCGIPSLCQQFMARIITAIQSTQEEFQLRWTRKLKEAVNPLLEFRGQELSDFKAWFGPVKHFMGGMLLASLGIVLTSWWQAECPKEFEFIPRASVQILLSGWDPCRKGSHSMLENMAEDGRKLAV